MFHLEQFDVCEDLRSTGITRLLCYSGLHPRSVALCLAPCHGRHPYSTPIRPRGQEPSRISLACCRSQCVARCRRRPRGGRVAIGCRFPSVVCGRSQTIDLSQRSFGATYRIQLLSLHLATFPPLLASDSGRLTRPSPVGFPPTGRTISRFTATRLPPLRGSERIPSNCCPNCWQEFRRHKTLGIEGGPDVRQAA